MQRKVLSVSIAAYNVEKYIEKTVFSIVSQPEVLEAIEIIIVNDGSKDSTSKIAHALEEKYPDTVVVVDKPNGGYGSTINASLRIAKGMYYKLLDGDDWYESKNLPDFIEYLKTNEADIVVSPYYEVYEGTNEIVLNDRHTDIPGKESLIEELSLADILFAMHEIAIKTDTLRQLDKAITEKRFYTDAEFVAFCIIAAKTISRFDKPVYCYRLGLEGQSVSLTGTRKHYKDLPVVAKKIFSSYEENQKELIGEKKTIVERIVLLIAYNTYRAYMLLEDPVSRRSELMDFDTSVKRITPEAYAISDGSSMIHFLRKFAFRPYRLLCLYTMKRFIKENKGK